jgi:hypothetical protein
VLVYVTDLPVHFIALHCYSNNMDASTRQGVDKTKDWTMSDLAKLATSSEEVLWAERDRLTPVFSSLGGRSGRVRIAYSAIVGVNTDATTDWSIVQHHARISSSIAWTVPI